MSSSNSFLTDEQLTKIFESVNTSCFRSAGAGGFHNMIQNIMVNFDRFGYNPVAPYAEHSGVTFITRPKLNLTSTSLRQSRVLTTMDTVNESSIQFAIRCLLDTQFTRDNAALAYMCPHFNILNPFLTPLCNCLTSISGFPDIVIDTEQSTGGFHSEDITFASGSDRLSRTYELNLNFRDIHGGIIMAILHYWSEYISLAAKGEVVSYSDDIDDNVIPYTVSIYRFLLDPSRKYVTKWAKATGCFLRGVPIGACMNVNEGEIFNQSSAKFSANFVANKIEYNDYAIIMDFNTLVKRYCPNIESMPSSPITANFNFTPKAVPYISTGGNGVELTYRYRQEDLDDPFEKTAENISKEISANRKAAQEKSQNAQSPNTLALNTTSSAKNADTYWIG